MNLDNAKVGDKLFVYNRMDRNIEIVERITQTLVITKYHRFAKNSGKKQGGDHLNALYARLATDEDMAMVKREQMIHKCENINFKLLFDSQLEEILKIINNQG